MTPDDTVQLCLFLAVAVAAIAVVFDPEEMKTVTNVVDAAKADVSTTRTGFRGAIASHPFTAVLISTAVGLVLGAVIGVAVL